jgi:hypothetical protein
MTEFEVDRKIPHSFQDAAISKRVAEILLHLIAFHPQHKMLGYR